MAEPGSQDRGRALPAGDLDESRQDVQGAEMPGETAAAQQEQPEESSDSSDPLMQTPELDSAFAEGLLALLQAPHDSAPETAASLPALGLPEISTGSEPEERREAIRRVASAPGGQDEPPGFRRGSGGAAATTLRSNSGGITPKAGRGGEARQARMRETNRASQQRWRARHKVRVQTNAEQLESLTQEMQEMQIQQDLLLERNALLERAYAMVAGSGPGSEERPRGGDGGESSGGRRDSGGVEHEATAWWLTEAMQEHLRCEMQLGGQLVFTVRPNEPRQLTSTELAAMSAEEFGRLQHEYVVAFAEHLLLRTAPLHTLTPEDDRLGQLVFEVGQLRGALLLAFPDHGRALRERGIPPKALGTAGDFTEAEGTPLYSARHQAWVQAVAATQLTEQQLRAVLGVRAAYINNAVVLARRRPALVHQLQALPPEGATAATEAVVQRNGELVAAMSALRCCLRDEHSNLVQAIWYICRRVLQPPQEAHLYTAAVSLGAPPDMLSFAEVVATSAGQPTTAAALAQVPPDAGLASLEEALLAAAL